MYHKLILLSIIILTGSCLSVVYAQAPQQFNYQAVIRDNNGQVMANKSIQLRFRLRNDGVNGPVKYTEMRTATTNEFGLVTAAINGAGSGSQEGSIGLVEWATGNVFLQVEVDHDKDGVFTDMGATQIVSAPYAMFATPLGNATGDLGGKYPNPIVNKLQGEPLDLSAAKYHGYTLKWDQVNNKWVTGKDEDGGPDFYFKATRNNNEDVTFIGMDPQFFWGLTYNTGFRWRPPYANLLRFRHKEADPYGLFNDSVFTTPVNGYYEFEVFLWFPSFHAHPMKPPTGFVLVGIEKNDSIKLTFTAQRYDNEEEADSKPIRLKRTVYLQAGDKLKFIMAHNSTQPVVLTHSPATPGDGGYQYQHINFENLTVTGRKLR